MNFKKKIISISLAAVSAISMAGATGAVTANAATTPNIKITKGTAGTNKLSVNFTNLVDFSRLQNRSKYTFYLAASKGGYNLATSTNYNYIALVANNSILEVSGLQPNTTYKMTVYAKLNNKVVKTSNSFNFKTTICPRLSNSVTLKSVKSVATSTMTGLSNSNWYLFAINLNNENIKTPLFKVVNGEVKFNKKEYNLLNNGTYKLSVSNDGKTFYSTGRRLKIEKLGKV